MMTMVPAFGPSPVAVVGGTSAAGPSSGAAAETASGCACGSGSGVAFQGRHESDSVDGATGSGADVSSSQGWLAVTDSASCSGSDSGSGSATTGAGAG